MICQSRIANRNGQCDDPRCSLNCRDNWAWKETKLLIHRLQEIEQTHFIYFGNVNFLDDVSPSEHKEMRSCFLKLLKNRDAKSNSCSKILFNSEPNRDQDRIHYHYCLYSDTAWKQYSIKTIWNSTTNGIRTIVKHNEPLKGIVPASKYMFKDLSVNPYKCTHVDLFSKSTLPITWGNRGFYGQAKTDVWKLIKPKRQTRWDT